MHNKRKVKTTEDKKREKLEASKQRAKEYIEMWDKFLQMKSSNDFSEEAFTQHTKMINMAGDCYTLWNFRKLVIENLEKSRLDCAKLYQDELKWLEYLLSQHPKSYWIWFHRKWITTRIPNMDWNTELALCTKALEMDSRNFHCWNYRRFVTVQAKVSLKDELSFTLAKINQNFSNYSSWHHRSFLMQRAYENDPGSFVQVLTEELELVQNAFYTSPEDQSAWFYHRWLVGMSKRHNSGNFRQVVEQELEKVEGLLEEEPNSKWPILTSVFLLVELGRVSEAKEKIAKLQEIDPQRKNYYADLLTTQ